MKPMIKKINYSRVREKVFPEKLEKERNDSLAFITHHLHANSDNISFLKKPLKGWLNGHTKDILSDPEFQYELKINLLQTED